MPVEDLKTQEGLNAFAARHKGVAGIEKVSPDRDPTTHRTVTDPVYKYTFGDGSTVSASSLGSGTASVGTIEEKVPSAATGTAPPTGPQTTIGSKDAQGNTITYVPDPDNPGQFHPAPGVPVSQTGQQQGPSSVPGPGGTVWVPNPDRSPGAPLFVPSGVAPDETTQAAAKANVQKTLLGMGLDQANIDKIYASTPADIRQTLSQAGVNEANQAKILSDIGISQGKAGPEIQKTLADTGLVTAQTGQAGANTQQILTNTSIAAGKAPYDIAASQAATAASNAQTAAALQKMNQPTVIQTSKDQPFNLVQMPNGQQVYSRNQNYQPTDPARQVGDLSQQANDYKAQLLDQIQKQQISPDDAPKMFNAWWQQNVEPQRAEILQNQQQQQFANQVLLSQSQNQTTQAQAQAQTSASGIGTAAVNAALAAPPGASAVSSDWGKTFGQLIQGYAGGKLPSADEIAKSATFEGPDTSAIYQQATADALKHISPTAASIAGAPMPQVPQGMDVNSMLSQSNFWPGGGGPPGAPGAQGAQPGATTQALGGNYNPQQAPMPAVPGPGGQMGPNLNPTQPQFPQGLTNPGNPSNPGANQPMVYDPKLGRMVAPGAPPAAGAAAAGAGPGPGEPGGPPIVPFAGAPLYNVNGTLTSSPPPGTPYFGQGGTSNDNLGVGANPDRPTPIANPGAAIFQQNGQSVPWGTAGGPTQLNTGAPGVTPPAFTTPQQQSAPGLNLPSVPSYQDLWNQYLQNLPNYQQQLGMQPPPVPSLTSLNTGAPTPPDPSKIPAGGASGAWPGPNITWPGPQTYPASQRYPADQYPDIATKGPPYTYPGSLYGPPPERPTPNTFVSPYSTAPATTSQGPWPDYTAPGPAGPSQPWGPPASWGPPTSWGPPQSWGPAGSWGPASSWGTGWS
jgi:hypothetical protein